MKTLPQELLVKRPRELDAIRNALAHKEKIVFVSGPIGTGKTTLLHMFINNYKELFPGGIYGGNVRNVDSFIGVKEVLSSLPSDRALIVADDFEYLNIAYRSDLINTVRNSTKLNLLAAGRDYNYEIIRKSLDVGHDWFKVSVDNFTQSEYKDLFNKRLNRFKDLNSDKLYGAIEGNPFLAIKFSETIDEGIVNWGQLLEGFRDFDSSGVFDSDDMPLPVEDLPPDSIIERVAFVNDQLLDRIKEDPKLMYGLSPRRFEELVAELLYKQGFEVELTPATRDGGFDIYAAKIESIGKFLYLVECKRYTPPKKVGVQVIRSLHGVVQKEQANAGIVVTSSYFTSDAKEFQSELEYQIKLSDYIGVQKLLKLI